jgi:protein TonB
VSEITQKKDVNLPKNSSLYFQIGLILCLLVTYGLLEMKFKMQLPDFSLERPIEDSDLFHMPDIVIEPNAPEQKQLDNRVALLTDKAPIIKPDDFVIKDPVSIITPEEYVPTPTVDIKSIKTIAPPVEPLPNVFNMIDVERVPIFPGCESASNNAERMACMSEKLTKLIQKKFNTDLAADLGLSGVQKIQVQFKIDDKGHVTDIKSRSPYSQLEKEAERVVNKIPTMTPGMQRDTPVSVIYNLPIVFKVH